MAVAASAIIALSWWARRVGPPSPMLLAALVGALSFWVLTAVTRADHGEPAASRYIYIGAVFIMLIAAEARLGAGVRGGWLALSGILIASALVGNLNVLRGGEGGLRAADSSVRASLAAVQIAAPVVSPAFEAEPTNAPQLTAGPYLAAVRDLGSPALTTRELAGAPELIREHSDTVLEHAERLAAVPYGGPSLPASPPTVEGSTGGRLLSRSACTVIVPAGGLGSLDLLSAPGASVVVRGTRGSIANVYLRRFASTFPGAPFATVAQGAREAVHFPVDLAPRLPWHVQVVAARPTAVCRA